EVGKSATLSVLGRNLPGSKPFSGEKVPDRALDVVNVTFNAPKDPLSLFRFPFLVHPAAPAAKLRGWQPWPKGIEKPINPANLLIADESITVEKEPNDSADKAQALTLPTVVCGRFDKPGDSDWYSFTAKAGDKIRIVLFCERLDAPGDPFVLVTDDKGPELAQFADHGLSFNALALA